MKHRRKRTMLGVLSAALVCSSVLAYPAHFTAYGAVTANPVISREVPAYSTAGTGAAASGNDKFYYSFWNATAPDYLAYDLSAVPEAQRKSVTLVWYNATGQFDYTILNGSPNGMPSDYTVEVNSAPGGTYPEEGWEVRATVTGNTLHSRQHVVDMTGCNWIRLHVTGSDGKEGGYISINMDVHTTAEGVSDSWIFYGDSITACGMMNCYGTGFAEYVHQIDSTYYPIQENGGIGGIRSVEGAANMERWLEMFPGKYVSIAYGTNDAWGNQTGAAQYYANTASMVEQVLATGKIPVVPRIPYATESGVGDNLAAYNAMVDKIYENYPDVVKGPDFEAYFREHPDLLSADGVHPSEQGYDGMRQLWAQTMYDVVYKTGDTPVAGDLNQDGACTVADVVLLQKWLMGAGTLTNWQAAELTGDGVIDSADLCILRRMLTNQ